MNAWIFLLCVIHFHYTVNQKSSVWQNLVSCNYVVRDQGNVVLAHYITQRRSRLTT